MNYISQREKDPQYLNTVIAHKQIIIDQLQTKLKKVQQQLTNTKSDLDQLKAKINSSQTTFKNQLLNLKMAVNKFKGENQALKKQNNEQQFNLNLCGIKQKQLENQHTKQMQYIKKQFQYQKETLMHRINKLQNDLRTYNKEHNLTYQNLHKDKLKIVEDCNRDMRGVAGQKQARIIIIENQRLNNEVEFQSLNIMTLLKKNEKLQEQMKHYKSQMEIHKSMETELIKRSSLAQNLIKQLNQRIRQLQAQLANSQSYSEVQSKNQIPMTPGSSRATSNHNQEIKTLKNQLNELKIQLSKQKNYCRYLENKQQNGNKKYQTLALILSNYLESLFFNKDQKGQVLMEGAGEIVLDLPKLKEKDIKQWKLEQLQTIVTLLLIQIKPYLSKKSLTCFPQIKNINISFMEQTNKQPLSLPKIAQDFNKNLQKEAKMTRFKDIPIDISTKILRSNLRQWGKKIPFDIRSGPMFKSKSKSIQSNNEKSLL